jgi:hypothetical protein
LHPVAVTRQNPLSKGSRSGSVAGDFNRGLMVKDLRTALDFAHASTTPLGGQADR